MRQDVPWKKYKYYAFISYKREDENGRDGCSIK